jgi:hypothetical protein
MFPNDTYTFYFDEIPTTPPIPNSSMSSLGAGAMAGIVVACAACALLLGLFLLWRYRVSRKTPVAASSSRRGAKLYM